MSAHYSRRRALATALGAAAFAPHPVRAQLAPIRIGTAVNDPYMTAFYARDEGFFRRAGVDVTVQPFINGNAVLQAAAAGAIDVGVGEPSQLANAFDHGFPLGLFAGGSLYSADEPTTILCVAKNSKLRTAKELEGGTVGVVTLRSLNHLSVLEWLTSNGADPTKVRFYELPYAEMTPALARGTLSAALNGEPYLTDAKDELREIAHTFDAIGKTFYINCWYARRDWLGQNGTAGRRIADAVYATARWVADHRAESAAIEAQYTKLDPARVRSMARNGFATQLEPRWIQPVLDIASKYKVLARQMAAAELVIRV